MISSPLEPLIGYGICMSVGIAWALILSSLTLPAMINMISWNPESNSIAKPSMLESLASFFGKIVTRFPVQTFSGGMILVLFGGIGIQKINVDVNIANFFKPGTEIRDSMDFMDREMSGTLDLRLRIEACLLYTSPSPRD